MTQKLAFMSDAATKSIRVFNQGLTLVHFPAQHEPYLTHTNDTTHPKHPVNKGYTTPTRTPYPIKALKLSSEVNECKPLPSAHRCPT